MERLYEIQDSSDWLNTPVAQLAPVEAALRCQVCKDFYNTPMITSCSHTFCSLCIRRCLTNDGKCPSCRASDQELRLRRNWVVEELVQAFQAARPSILRLGQDYLDTEVTEKAKYNKRKLSDVDTQDLEQPHTLRRKTRSQGRRLSKSLQTGLSDEEEPTPSSRYNKDSDFEPDDNLSACPICDKKMKVEDVFLHLDTHQDKEEQGKSIKSKPPSSSLALRTASRSMTPAKSLDRLPSLSYSILTENALRKKLSASGIPNWGPKQLLIRRHTEWLNLWNSNCDSSRPRSKRDLINDLDVWERTQGGHAPNNLGNNQNGPNSVMNKEFDGAAWAATHSNDFQDLIARARQKAKTPNSNPTDKSLEEGFVTKNDASSTSSRKDSTAINSHEPRASSRMADTSLAKPQPDSHSFVDLIENESMKDANT